MSKPTIRLPLVVLFAGVWLLEMPGAAARVQYDQANDFTDAANPNGPWSYGYAGTLGGPMTIYDKHTDSSAPPANNVLYGRHAVVSGAPGVFYNPTDIQITIGSTHLFPNQVLSHPGPHFANLSQYQYSVIRFQSPTTSTYTLNSYYYGANIFSATTDIHVLLNGVSLFDALLAAHTSGPPGELFFDQVGLTLSPSDTLDFVVGYGPTIDSGMQPRTFYDDATGVSVTLTAQDPTGFAMPEAPTLVVWGCLSSIALGIGVCRTRRVETSSPRTQMPKCCPASRQRSFIQVNVP